VNRFVYLDNNATTKITDGIYKKLLPYLELQYGNPSSLYSFGKNVKDAIESARRNIADLIKCEAGNIVFTSGGSEGNCAAINSAIKQYTSKKKIITTKVEHSSVLEYCKLLELQGYSTVLLDVDKNGALDYNALAKEIDDNTACVSIQYANNETGVVFDTQTINSIISDKKKSHDFVFIMDCVQALGKVELDVSNLDIDIGVFSGHKIHAPKGCGFMYIKETGSFMPLISGHQEKGLRGGTENVVGIVAMGEAAKLISDNLENVIAKEERVRNYLENRLLEIPKTTINAKASNRLPNTTSITFENANGNELMFKLEKHGVCISTGSACNSESSQPSHVLVGMGIGNPENTIRISISEETTESQIDYFVESLKKCL